MKRSPIPETVLGLLPGGRGRKEKAAQPERSFTLTLPEPAYLELLDRAQGESREQRRRVGVVAVARDLVLDGLKRK